jgi:hypothetical protein
MTIPSCDPHERSRLAPYRWTAVQLLAERDLELPDWEALTLIIESALASRDLYYAASMTRPTQACLDEHFAAFVLSYALPAIAPEAA